MSRKTNPFFANCVPALKFDRMLMNEGHYLTMSADSLRLYLVACWFICVYHNDFVRIPLNGLQIDLTREQIAQCAAEIEAADLLFAAVEHNHLEIRLPDRSVGRIKHPPDIEYTNTLINKS
jgi:hypothetical protein